LRVLFKKSNRCTSYSTIHIKVHLQLAKNETQCGLTPNDAAVCGDFNLPKDLLSSIKMPAIVIDSSKSPQSLRKPVQAVAEALANGKQVTLKGTVHGVPPKILVPVLENFFNG